MQGVLKVGSYKCDSMISTIMEFELFILAYFPDFASYILTSKNFRRMEKVFTEG